MSVYNCRRNGSLPAVYRCLLANAVVRIGSPGPHHTPYSQGGVAPPLFGSKGRRHTQLRGRGGGIQFRRRDRHSGTLSTLYSFYARSALLCYGMRTSLLSIDSPAKNPSSVPPRIDLRIYVVSACSAVISYRTLTHYNY